MATFFGPHPAFPERCNENMTVYYSIVHFLGDFTGKYGVRYELWGRMRSPSTLRAP